MPSAVLYWTVTVLELATDRKTGNVALMVPASLSWIVTSPTETRSRERSLAELSDADLARLFDASQPSGTSPEADYTS